MHKWYISYPLEAHYSGTPLSLLQSKCAWQKKISKKDFCCHPPGIWWVKCLKTIMQKGLIKYFMIVSRYNVISFDSSWRGDKKIYSEWFPNTLLESPFFHVVHRMPSTWFSLVPVSRSNKWICCVPLYWILISNH